MKVTRKKEEISGVEAEHCDFGFCITLTEEDDGMVYLMTDVGAMDTVTVVSLETGLGRSLSFGTRVNVLKMEAIELP